MTDPETIVDVISVTKRFGDKQALSDVSWKVPRGRISGLLGPNGAGKTTLFRLLMGILEATSGRLLIDGLECFADRVKVKRLVGYLPDEPVFYSYLKGYEVLELSAGMHGLDIGLARKRLDPLIARLQMAEALHDYAEDYSRGMKKKLGLLLALIHDPPLLVLDEPTNGLDVESTHLFFDLMRELCDLGRTVVFSTHLLDQVERLCSHGMIIDKGNLVAAGTLDELRRMAGDGMTLEQAFLSLTRR